MNERIKNLKETSGSIPIYIAKIAIEYGKRLSYCSVCYLECDNSCMFLKYKNDLKKELYTYTGEVL
jgi:hypothetical protein